MRFLLFIALFILSTPALAVCGDTTSPAAQVVKNHWLSETGDPRQTCIFYGDYSGDGAADALALYYFHKPGDGVVLEAAMFRAVGGTFRFDGSADIDGQNPRDVRFKKGGITLVTTLTGPDDLWCCSTPPRDWTIRTP
ncbi:hypothetical protein [Aurantimonas sp. VKM B-3413]|uniref:hypothetical protein n=1 Tax=Aurantimonas sp. VKM B-3413 TaxID=2779401 RepID=UPI001E29E5B2|nr:hypothetical protein [Aurantimonas sp. VKM B-3413]MCB8836882.1 hypothetical protein [Aurantimonas sp. VKM B-3413]